MADCVEKVFRFPEIVCFIYLLAGLKIMMGHRQTEQAALFYEFSFKATFQHIIFEAHSTGLSSSCELRRELMLFTAGCRFIF